VAEYIFGLLSLCCTIASLQVLQFLPNATPRALHNVKTAEEK
jgi:hypothetical protein